MKKDGELHWFILIPEKKDISKVSDLNSLDQKMLYSEIQFITNILEKSPKTKKVNTAIFSNIVNQLHIHLIQRKENDRAWPQSILGTESKTKFDNKNVTQWQKTLENELSKKEKYKNILKTFNSLSKGNEVISNMANLCSLLHQEFNHHWVGFYLVNNKKKELYLGPFNGPLACTNISYNRGVCGKSYAQKKVFIVDNVHNFDDHIACSAFSNSEIVIPIIKNKEVIAVLDIDSINYNNFDSIDERYLKDLVQMI